MKEHDQEVARYPPQIKCSKALECGNVTEVTKMSYIPRGTIQRVDKHHYIVKSETDFITGEIVLHEYQQTEKKIDNLHSIRQSIARMRRIINTNTERPEFVRWVTLTYADKYAPRLSTLLTF